MIAAETVNALARRYQRGDMDALEPLYDELRPVVYAAIRRTTLPHSMTVEDARQESWLLLADIAQAWPGRGYFLGYVLVSFRRWVMWEKGYDRGGRRRGTVISHDILVGIIDRHVVHGSAPEQEAVVADILASLPEPERRAVTL